jgi:hypothetical protein
VPEQTEAKVLAGLEAKGLTGLLGGIAAQPSVAASLITLAQGLLGVLGQALAQARPEDRLAKVQQLRDDLGQNIGPLVDAVKENTVAQDEHQTHVQKPG